MLTQNKELQDYRGYFYKELLHILNFWKTYAVEKNRNGFYGAVDLENLPVLDAKKSCVLNARILWTFSAAASFLNDQNYKELADLAYHVIIEKFADPVNGGFFMELTADNQVSNDMKHTYAQAFVLYALCKYYECNKSPKVFQIIKDFFLLIEKNTKDQRNPGYLEAFTCGWEPIFENRMADNNEPKSMNTHLHLLEAYTGLYQIWKDDQLKQKLVDLLMIFFIKIIRHNGHLGIFFNDSFQETNPSSSICSFGHDIEASWLLWEAVNVLDNKELISNFKPLVIRMVDVVEREGVDKDGGLFLESYRFGSHIRTNKHWWLQAENLVGFMNVYSLTGKSTYWETVKLTWQFIHDHVIDHDNGEWFTKVNRNGDPYLEEPPDDPSPYYRNDRKIDPWKCPYHNSRAMMELIKRIDQLNFET